MNTAAPTATGRRAMAPRRRIAHTSPTGTKKTIAAEITMKTRAAVLTKAVLPPLRQWRPRPQKKIAGCWSHIISVLAGPVALELYADTKNRRLDWASPRLPVSVPAGVLLFPSRGQAIHQPGYHSCRFSPGGLALGPEGVVLVSGHDAHGHRPGDPVHGPGRHLVRIGEGQGRPGGSGSQRPRRHHRQLLPCDVLVGTEGAVVVARHQTPGCRRGHVARCPVGHRVGEVQVRLGYGPQPPAPAQHDGELGPGHIQMGPEGPVFKSCYCS